MAWGLVAGFVDGGTFDWMANDKFPTLAALKQGSMIQMFAEEFGPQGPFFTRAGGHSRLWSLHGPL
ncbi:MAG: hypothetical protein CM15mP120_15150 [Pseudomonadota bacterium]|nr:MAG: hypothetical protein CM15mP120_15150 [Pseudomonadota bacterium]